MRTLSKKSIFLLFLSCLFYAAYALIIIASIYFNASIVVVAGSNKDLNAIVSNILIRFTLFVLSYLCIAIVHKVKTKFLSNAEVELKDKLMRSIMSRSYADFKKKESSYYINLLLTDTDTYRDEYLNAIPAMVNSAVTLLAAAYMLFRFHPLLLLLGVVMSVVTMFAVQPFSNVLGKKTEKFSEESEGYNRFLKEVIDGYETIKINEADSGFVKNYKKFSENKQNAWGSLNFLRRLSFETFMSAAGLSAIVAVAVGAYLVYQGYFEAAWILAIISYFTSLSNQISNLSSQIVDFKASKTIEKKLFDELSVPSVERSGKKLDFNKGISVNNLTFSYGDRKIFDNASFEFEPGKCYAIVGESGSGKSTLVKLLLKYYDDYSGQISLEGQELKELSNVDIYENIGLVNQSPLMFNASLEDNINLYKEDRSRYDEIIKRTNLEKLSSMIGDQNVGSFGEKISGGEKQRINIARILTKDADIIIFDEPTTGLDPQNKKMIDELIFGLEGKTRIVITHDWNREYLDRFDKVYEIGERA